MRLLPEKSTLIVIGAFNQALLNPSWIGKHILQLDGEQPLQVEMQAPFVVGVNVMPPRLSFGGISYSVTSQRLTFHFEDQDEAGAAKILRIAKGIFELLPHTPVSGMGFNFAFEAEQPSRKIASLLTAENSLLDIFGEQDSRLVIQSWGNSVLVGDELVTVTCQYDFNKVALDLNFHRNATDATAVCAVLADEHAFARRLHDANLIATSLNEGDPE